MRETAQNGGSTVRQTINSRSILKSTGTRFSYTRTREFWRTINYTRWWRYTLTATVGVLHTISHKPDVMTCTSLPVFFLYVEQIMELNLAWAWVERSPGSIQARFHRLHAERLLVWDEISCIRKPKYSSTIYSVGGHPLLQWRRILLMRLFHSCDPDYFPSLADVMTSHAHVFRIFLVTR